jgi:2-polyprenyl-6-methoxyphenol hydroxylase-like FAD-dependent oxidoreductase
LAEANGCQNGKKLQSIDKDGSKVVASFEDGSAARGDVLIGCDGAKSAVRECFLGKETAQLTDLDIQMFNLSCSFPKDVALLQRNSGHPIFKNSYHPKGFMWWQSVQDVQDPDKPETWLFQNIISWVGAPRPDDFQDQPSRLKYWQDVAKDFAEPWKSVGASLTSDLSWRTDTTTIYKPFDWSDKRLSDVVTLAGDAAHAIPAHRVSVEHIIDNKLVLMFCIGSRPQQCSRRCGQAR